MNFILEIRRHKKPLYRELVTQLVQCIKSGRLAVGSALPPTRELSKSLKVSRSTVVKAYDELVRMGWAEVPSTHGTFIKADNFPVPHTSTELHRRESPPVIPDSLTQQAAPAEQTPERSYAAAPLPERISNYANRLLSDETMYPISGFLPQLNFGGSPIRTLPVRKWQHLLIKHCTTIGTLVYRPDTLGRIELRRAIAEYLRRTKGITCSSEQVAIFTQTQNALNVLCRLLLNMGDGVAVEEPGFGGIKNTAVAQNLRISPIEIDSEGLKVCGGLDAVEPVKLIYVTASHQDPTGTTMSLERRKSLLDYAYRNGAWVIEDEFDSNFLYGTRPVRPLTALDSGQCVIYMSSFWQALYPLTAIGYLIVPPPLIALLRSAKALTEPNSSVLEELVLAEYIQSGALEQHLRKLKNIFSHRRSALLHQLKVQFKEHVEIARESAGTHQVIRFDVDCDHSLIADCASAAGLGLESSRQHYLGVPKRGEFLVDFSSVNAEESAQIVAEFHRLMVNDAGLAR